MVKLEGIFPVLITPMNSDYSVNWDGLKQNIEYFVSQGVAGIVVNGSTGEFVSLTKEERKKITELAVEQVNGRIPVMVGTAAETTDEAIEYTKFAEDVGADASLLINSYYAHPKENEIYEHFKAVAESVSIPIMIYNNPFTTGVNISTETILRVARDVDNITHVKESSGDITKLRDLTRQGQGFLKTFCGTEDLALESFLVGATGWISVAGNVVPQLAIDLFNSVQEKNFERAWELYDQLLPFCKFLEGSGKYIQIIKRAMDLRGLAGGPSRKPRLPLSDEEESTLQQLLNDLLVTK